MSAPRRIASLISSATEMLYAIGLRDRVVAVSHECDYPDEVLTKPRVTLSHIGADKPSQVIDDQVKQLLSQGEPLYDIDAKLLAELGPDLIVTQAQCDVCAIRYDDVIQTVNSIEALRGTRVLSLNPLSLEEILSDIHRVGQAVGATESAERVVDQLKERIAAIVTKTAGLSPRERPRVASIEWIEPVMFAGNWMPRLVEIAGGKNGLSEAGKHSGYGNWNALVDFDPEVIVLMPCGFDLSRTLEESHALSSFSGWASLSAVKADRVFAVDGNAYFNRSGPRLVDSLEMLAHWIHPEVVEFRRDFQKESAWRRISTNP